MRFLVILVFSLFINLCSFAQPKTVQFNKSLADSLGADEYGMKTYMLVILKTGKGNVSSKAVRDSLFGGHMQNIGRMAANGKLVVAGPMGKNDKNYEGIFILNVSTIAEAKSLLLTDPAIQAGLLDSEIYQWYGSAALPLYLKYHQEVQKTQF